MQHQLAQDINALQQQLMAFAARQKSVALVPTMGALHAGHLALITAAKQLADEVVVSIFVNPKQFGAGEDFTKYPRPLEADIEAANKAGAALIYAPSGDDMYPDGFSTSISVGPIADILCGAHRPGHFDGVATVVAKLLLRVLPTVTVFGEKDYQQLCVIRRLVADMDMPITIAGAAIVREEDGLAMSSRNAYLSEEERATAPKLFEILQTTKSNILSDASNVDRALNAAKAALKEAGFALDYLELRKEHTLEPVGAADVHNARLLVAAALGKTRLIDNIAMGDA